MPPTFHSKQTGVTIYKDRRLERADLDGKVGSIKELLGLKCLLDLQVEMLIKQLIYDVYQNSRIHFYMVGNVIKILSSAIHIIFPSKINPL